MNQKPVLGQKVFYIFGSDGHFGRVIGIYDDFFIVSGQWIGKVKLSYDTKHSIRDFTLLFKDGQPVISKRYIFKMWVKAILGFKNSVA